MTMFSKLKTVSEMMEKARAEMKKNGKEALKEAFAEFFNAHPDISALQWTQYTPYFNDGEPCTFSRGDIDFQLAGEEEDDDFHYSDYGMDQLTRDKLKPAMAALNELQDLFDDDLAQSIFGDGVKVIATIDGFEVNEYDHD